MVTIMLTDVLSLAIMHQVDSGASSSDLYVGLEFMSEALRDFFIMLMMPSMYHFATNYPSMHHISTRCLLTKPSSPSSITLSFLMKIRSNYLVSHLRSLDWLLTSMRSEEHTSELQSPDHLVCRLLLEKKK